MKQDTATPTAGERVAFTLRLDGSLDFDTEVERAALARHLGVPLSKLSKNDVVVRALRFYLAAAPEVRMSWRPTAEPTPAVTNGHGKRGR
jgi:hypothetical protein